MSTPVPTTETKPYPATLIAVVGPSGAGKSTSLRNLPQNSTVIFDMERKGMPFKTTASLLRPDNIRFFKSDFATAVKDPAIKLIVIDSITALIDMLQTECEASYKGFDIWKYYNDGIGELCRLFKTSGKCVVVTALDEIVMMTGLDGNNTTQRRIFVQGKEWANKGIESECLAVWYAFGKKSASGGIEYKFATQTDGMTKAKTPIFWNLPNPVDNDLKNVLDLVAKNL